MADYDGELKIKTQIISGNLRSQLLTIENRITKTAREADNLKQRMQELGSAKIPTAQYAELQKELEQTTAKAAKLDDQLIKLEDLGRERGLKLPEVQASKSYTNTLYEYNNAQLKALDIQQQMNELQEKNQAFTSGKESKEYAEAQTKLEDLGRQQEIYAQQVETAQNRAALAQMKASDQAQKAADKEAKATTKKATAGTETAGVEDAAKQADLRAKATDSIFASLISSTTRLTSALKPLGTTLMSLGQASLTEPFRIAQSAIEGLASAAKSAVGRIASGFTGLGTRLTRLFRRLTRMASRVFVFSVILRGMRAVSSGIGNAMTALAQHDAQLRGSMISIEASLKGLQGAFASAFSPIIQAVVPYLVTLINWLNAAVTAIGHFFAALTGHSSYRRIVADNAAIANSYNKVGNAANKAALGLQNFDELNNLNESKAGSGGSGNDPTAGFKYEEDPIDETMKRMAEELKNNPYNFGYDLADMVADQLEKIPWDKIRRAALKVGQKFAEILNGVFANLRFATDLGVTLAQGLNTALDFLYGFITTFNWTQFGVWWGYLFNAFVNATDWDLLGKTITAGINGVIASLFAFFNTIYLSMGTLGSQLGKQLETVLTGINWKGVADVILMGVADINEALGKFNQSINWTEVADSMVAGVNEVARGMVMDPTGQVHLVWEENGVVVGNAIQNFFAGIHEFVTNIPWTQLTEDLSAWFQNAVGAIDFEQLGDTINSMIANLMKSAAAFINNPQNRETFITALSDFIEGLDITELVGSVMDLAGALLTLMFQTLEDVLSSMSWKEIGVMILTAILAGLVVSNPIILAVAALGALLAALLMKVVDQVANTISAGMENVKSIIDTMCAAIGDAWNGFWNTVASVAQTIWNTIVGIVTGAINGVRGIITTVMGAIQSFWSATWNAIAGAGRAIWNGISGTVSSVFENIRSRISGVLDAIYSKWKTIWTGMKDFLKGAVNGIIGFINGMIGGVESGINKMIHGLNHLHFEIPDWVPSIGGKSLGFDIDDVKMGRVPTLANGAVIQGGSPFMAVLGDQPAGQTNVEAPLDTIVEAVRDAQGDQIAVLQEQNDILRAILQKSGILSRDIFNTVVDENNAFINRNGRSAFAY